jgi:hypothetical protein
MIMSVQPGAIETGSADEEGCLVLADGRLVAVLVRLSDRHGDMAGRSYLEHGFGRLDGPTHPTFSTVNEASDWIARRLCERDQNPSTPRV